VNADLLRRAAALMRERAEAATPGEWAAYRSGSVAARVPGQRIAETVANTFPTGNGPKHNAAHIASWHPAVALAVADWLDEVGENLSDGIGASVTDDERRSALAVARAYLGDQP
jgi:hypothetical protein